MRIRYVIAVAISCLVAVAAFGQAKGIAGKWGTAAAPAAGVVMLDLKVDAGNKVTGSITEYGNALCGSPDTNLKIDSGTVDAKVVTFVTTRPNPCPAAGAPEGPPVGTAVTWTGTLADDDSLSVTRAIGGRGGAGGGGRGAGGGAPGGGAPGAGGGPGGGAGGRGPGGGAPGAGGPPAAAGAAPAGVQGGGAPGGGGRGAGGGGRGGALVMHRLP